MRRAWLTEIRATLALAVPFVLTNLAQMAITTTDIVMMGWIGPEALAAGTLGFNVFFLIYIFGIGMMTATAPMLAQEIGRFRHSVRDTRRTVRQGIWLAGAIALPSGLLLSQTETILRAMGQDHELSRIAGEYVQAMQWGLLPFYAFTVLRSFIAALERPMAGLIITTAAIFLNVFTNWCLMFGNLGAPALGVVGAGLSSTIANTFMFLALALYLVSQRRTRRYHLFGRFWKPDRERFFAMMRLGLPIAATVTFEVSIFNIAALAAGLLGTAVIAAHAIAIQTAAISFMVPMGIGQAATVRVGLAAGRRDSHGINLAGNTAILLGLGFAVLAGLGMFIAPDAIISLYLGELNAAPRDVVAYATTFLMIAAIFQLADAGQAVAAGALRGLKDARAPMVIAALAYWGAGLPLALLLAFPAGLGGTGLWIGLALALLIAATALIGRWHLRARLGLMAGYSSSSAPGMASASPSPKNTPSA